MEFNINIIGNKQVGKKSYIGFLLQDNLMEGKLITVNNNVYKTKFKTNNGLLKINFNLSENILENQDGYILMFSVTDYQSFLDTVNKIKNVNKVKKPFVVCGNKVDSTGRQVFPLNIRQNLDIKNYVEISCATGFNTDRLLTKLFRKILYNGIYFRPLADNIKCPVIDDHGQIKYEDVYLPKNVIYC